jgi:hypothetical protein
MKPFLDAGLLAILLLKAPGRRKAWELVQRFEAPYYLTHLHVLLIEHMFLHAKGEKERQAALIAEADWTRHWDEGVFQLELVDALAVSNLALDLNRRSSVHSAKPLHYLLVASAAASQSTHFLAFDPRTRYLAKLTGLKVLPQAL